MPPKVTPPPQGRTNTPSYSQVASRNASPTAGSAQPPQTPAEEGNKATHPNPKGPSRVGKPVTRSASARAGKEAALTLEPAPPSIPEEGAALSAGAPANDEGQPTPAEGALPGETSPALTEQMVTASDKMPGWTRCPTPRKKAGLRNPRLQLASRTPKREAQLATPRTPTESWDN